MSGGKRSGFVLAIVGRQRWLLGDERRIAGREPSAAQPRLRCGGGGGGGGGSSSSGGKNAAAIFRGACVFPIVLGNAKEPLWELPISALGHLSL